MFCFAASLKGWCGGESAQQCGPDSNPGVDAICGFCFFLIIWGLSLFYMWVEFVLIWLILICGLSLF